VAELIILGGPNGAGKTTAAQNLLPKALGIREFVNADEIARGLSPFNPDAAAFAAGRLMVERIRALATTRVSFGFETTCAGRGHVHLIERCRSVGYRATLVFLWLPSAQAALERVARRLRAGGHGVPREIVTRRYEIGLRNMRHLYLAAVDEAMIYDNSDRGRVLIAERVQGKPLMIHDAARWKLIEEGTR
jgi:predicted ABC-type ATPase